MRIDSAEVNKLLAELAEKKPIFCSEMDFQLHLAWEMKERGWELSLEYDPQCFQANAAIDILVQTPERVAIELKYKTAVLDAKIHGRPLKLKNQAAQNQARFDFLWDIYRVERVVAAAQAERGFAVFLTNDSTYWHKGRAGTSDAQFRMFDGRRLEAGLHEWGPLASEGTRGGRDAPISIVRDYTFGWKKYARCDAKKNGEFRYLLIEVDPLDAPFPTAVPSA